MVVRKMAKADPERFLARPLISFGYISQRETPRDRATSRAFKLRERLGGKGGAVSQNWLVRFLEHRVGDKRIIRLIQKWLKAGILEDGVVTVDDRGTGQGPWPGTYVRPRRRLNNWSGAKRRGKQRRR